MVNQISRAVLADNARPRKNYVINGDMKVWQRGDSASLTSTGSVFGADRWKVSNQNNDGSGAPGIDVTKVSGPHRNNALRIEVTSGHDLSLESDSFFGFEQRLEKQEVEKLLFGGSSDEFTLSFWVRSNVTGVFTVTFNIIQSNSGLSDDRLVIGREFAIATAGVWQKVELAFPKNVEYDWSGSASDNTEGLRVTFVLDTSPNRVTLTENTWMDPNTELRNYIMVSNTAGFASTAGNYLEFTEAQLEEGATATDFEYRSIAEELALCQRYCYVAIPRSGYAYRYGEAAAVRMNGCEIPYPVTMRTTPAVSLSGGSYSNCSHRSVAANKDSAVHRVDVGNAGVYRVFGITYELDAEL